MLGIGTVLGGLGYGFYWAVENTRMGNLFRYPIQPIGPRSSSAPTGGIGPLLP